MSLITLVCPPGFTGRFNDSAGNVVVADATGRVQVDPAVVNFNDFIGAGFQQDVDLASAVRPTATYPGMPYFDTTLGSNSGRPIWRNGTNTAWLDSTGAIV